MSIVKAIVVSLICLGSAGNALAIQYAHTGYVDTAAPLNVTGQCTSSYTGATISTFPFISSAPDWFRYNCKIYRSGIVVALQVSPVLGTARADSFSAVSWTLSAPRQNNCVYCTKNKGIFYDINNGSQVIWSTGDGNFCGTTGYGPGGGGSGGEP